MNQRILWVLGITAGFAIAANARQYVFPAKGQTPEQQKKDESACHSWAV